MGIKAVRTLSTIVARVVSFSWGLALLRSTHGVWVFLKCTVLRFFCGKTTRKFPATPTPCLDTRPPLIFFPYTLPSSWDLFPKQKAAAAMKWCGCCCQKGPMPARPTSTESLPSTTRPREAMRSVQSHMKREQKEESKATRLRRRPMIVDPSPVRETHRSPFSARQFHGP